MFSYFFVPFYATDVDQDALQVALYQSLCANQTSAPVPVQVYLLRDQNGRLQTICTWSVLAMFRLMQNGGFWGAHSLLNQWFVISRVLPIQDANLMATATLSITDFGEVVDTFAVAMSPRMTHYLFDLARYVPPQAARRIKAAAAVQISVPNCQPDY